MSDDIPEVNAQRRRRGSTPTGQAGRPVRKQENRPSSGSGGIGMTPSPTSAGSGSSGSSGSGLGGLGSGLGSLLGSLGSGSGTTGRRGGCGSIIGVILVVVVIIFIIRNCSGDGISLLSQVDQQEPGITQPTQDTSFVQPVSPTATRGALPTSSGRSGDKWLVMLYHNADDQSLERDIFIDFNEAELIGSSPDVTIVSQLDRFKGGFSGDGDWSSTRRYLVQYDDDLNRIGSELIADIGEANMGDAATLVDFVSWASNTYPADNYVLIMSDHGMGWPGGWSDPAPAQRDRSSSAPLTAALQDDILYLNEMEDALRQIQATTNIEQFELIGLDVCLMSMMEVYSALAPYTKYAVASEETEPGVGWAYSAFLSLLVYDPTISTADLATNIVESYIVQDERVTDDQARAEFLAQNSSGGGWYVNRMSAAQLASQLQQNITLTAVNLENFQGLVDSVNEFSYQLQRLDQRVVAEARGYTQSYTSIFGSNVPPSFIDLGHFVQLIYKNTNDTNVRTAAENVINSLNQVIVAEKHGPGKPGSTGIAIYFPNSQLYSTPTTGMSSYTVIADSFSRYSLWDDFLAYHYSGRQFQATAAEPVLVERASQIPGTGYVQVSEIEASSNVVSPGESVELSTVITGENIGYIYFFTGLLDETSNSIYVADTDYLESPQTGQEAGVYYPVWPNAEQFRLNFEFEPLIFTIVAGDQEVLALFNPQSYGRDYTETVYYVDGTYTFVETGENRTAQLLFRDEKLFQVLTFTGGTSAGAPWETTPNIGDTFTISRRWLDMDTSGNVTGISFDEGDTITFTGDAIEWGTQYLPDGTYLVGFLIADMDGNITPAYTQITVR